MKKKVISGLLVGLALVLTMTSCGDNSSNNNNQSTNPSTDSSQFSTQDESTQLASYKTAAISKLDELINPAIDKLSNQALKTAIQTYYDTEKAYINGITDLDTAKGAVNKVVDDTKAFVKTTLKSLAVDNLNEIINPLIEAIPDNALKESVQNFYNAELEKVASIETLVNATDTYEEILDATKEFIKTEISKKIDALKNKALEELELYSTALINKIPYDTLKTDTQTFYTEEKKLLASVDTIEGVEPCVIKIKEDLEKYAFDETKKLAISELQAVVDAGLAKIPNQELKEDLNEFSNTEIAKLNAVTKLEDIPTTLSTVLTETAAHIKNLLVTTVKDYLSRLTQIETATAYDYLPEKMSPYYKGNQITNLNDINYDFTVNTQVSNINLAGYGEQWQMVVENINESIIMAKVFNVAQTVLSAAGNAVDIYLTNSYADEMNYEFSGNGYTGVFKYKDEVLTFNINITSSVIVPGIGEVKPVVKMEYDLVNDAKGMFIKLGDAYKVKYVIRENAYEMATTYGLTTFGHSGTRSSYLSISKANGKTTGHIYEYTTLDGSDKVQACVDFYVENNYVSVVGNKASGMVAFTGYVNELYKADEGSLIGYEVREEKTIGGVTAQYNTLWFNLNDISQITSIRVTDKTDANQSSRSTVDVYINNSSELFVPTYNKKIVKTSRKYDIELRKRYYYSYDENEKLVCHEVEVPMMFIQEGANFSSFTADMSADNHIASKVKMATADLNKILDDYATLIDIFKKNKDNMSSAQIIAYLAQYE